MVGPRRRAGDDLRGQAHVGAVRAGRGRRGASSGHQLAGALRAPAGARQLARAGPDHDGVPGAEAAAMEARKSAVLGELGFADPYRPRQP